MDGRRRLAVAGSGTAPARNDTPWELTGGRCTTSLKLIFDGVSSYGIAAMREDRFAHLRTTAGDGGGWQR
jgi:hypothetical protein